jgi:hypothetical protein
MAFDPSHGSAVAVHGEQSRQGANDLHEVALKVDDRFFIRHPKFCAIFSFRVT